MSDRAPRASLRMHLRGFLRQASAHSIGRRRGHTDWCLPMHNMPTIGLARLTGQAQAPNQHGHRRFLMSSVRRVYCVLLP